MKRFASILIALLMLAALTVPVFADGLYVRERDGSSLDPTHELVVDEDDLLTDEEEEILRENALRISEARGCEVIILTVYNLGGLDAETYAEDYFYDNGYGVGPERDGILLLVSMEDRDYWEATSGKAIEAFTDYGLLYLEHQFLSKLSSGDYYESFLAFQNTCDLMLGYYDGTLSDAERESLERDYNDFAEIYNPDGYVDDYEGYGESTRSRKPTSFVTITILALIAGFVLSMVPMATLKSQIQNVQRRTSAGDYLRKDSFDLSVNQDNYLYSNVTSRLIETQSRSSSGGGHIGLGGGGSSTHTHSSGSTFGGHGGKF